MKRLIYTFFFFLTLLSNNFSQIQWQEHLSHDRMAYGHHGHFIVDGDIVMVMANLFKPMNTLETITGNTTKAQDVIKQSFTFNTKTTITGIDSKEVMLIQPSDYDISGYSAFSIYERDDIFTINDIQGEDDIEFDDYLYISDAFMSGGPLDDKECIVFNSERYFLTHDDIILGKEDINGKFVYHEGLDGLPYQILDGTISSITAPPLGTIDLGNYDMILNNPYEYQLVTLKGSTMNRYSYDDFSFVRSDDIAYDIIHIQFKEGGFYYLKQTNNSYQIFEYSDDNSASTFFYELPKTNEIANFNIREIEVIGDDIYFFGLYGSNFIQENFSYVQKRTLNQNFSPKRKDLAITSASGTRLQLGPYEYFYTYDIDVKNESNEEINHFTIITDRFGFDFGPTNQRHKIDVSQPLAPGESYNLEGSFTNYGFGNNTITFNIIGVDYGLDWKESNNDIEVDVVILSNKDLEEQKFTISPNPSSDVISIDGLTSDIVSVTITDCNSRQIQLSYSDLSNIDISALQVGQYWIQINTKTNSFRQAFIKL